MKKIIILMALCAVIIVGVINYGAGYVASAFGGKNYKVTSNSYTLGATISGDMYIANCGNTLGCNSISVSSNDYIKLHNFILDNQLALVDEYSIDDILVSRYYSPWYSGCYGGANFEVADYGDGYVIGYPYIYEGF